MSIEYPNKISGPKSLTVHYNSVEGKTVYVFGEIHGSLQSCPESGVPSINEYLQHVFQTTLVPIDLFVESQLYLIQETKSIPKGKFQFGPPRDNYMTRIREDQVNIYNYMPMVRSHYIDPRPGLYTPAAPDFNMFSRFINIIEPFNFKTSDDIEELMFTYALAKDMWLEDLGIQQANDFIEYIVNFVVNRNNYVAKEFKRSYMKDKILDFIIRTIHIQYFEVHDRLEWALNIDLVPIMEVYTQEQINNARRAIYEIRTFIFELNGLFHEIYLLSRMFKRFNIDLLPSWKSPLFQSEPINMIVYTGDHHSALVRAFLGENGYALVEHSTMYETGGIQYKRCLDISSITQPLFSVIWK